MRRIFRQNKGGEPSMLIGLHNIPLLAFVIELNYVDELRKNHLSFQRAF